MRRRIACLLVGVIILNIAFLPIPSASGESTPSAGGVYYIKNVRSGKYLTVNGNNIEQSTLTYETPQRFRLNVVSIGNNNMPYYEIVPDCDSSKRIDVCDASDTNGANIQIFISNPYHTEAQRFCFKFDGGYKYKIQPELSLTRVFDVVDASPYDGANVQLYTERSVGDLYVDAQEWYFYPAVKSLAVTDLVDSGKHLDYQSESTFSSYADQARNIWNGYKSGVVRKYIPLILIKDVSIKSGNLRDSAIAQTNYANKTITISLSAWTNLSEAEKTNVLCHEMGHALGMGHLNEEANIMYYENSQIIMLHQNNKDSYDAAYARY